MATITDVLRTVIECRGAETVASQFGTIADAANEAEERVSGFVKKAATVANVSGGIALAGAGAAAGLLKSAGAAEQAQVAFTTLLKSPQAAKKHLQDLATFAAQTPFEFAGLRETSTQLLAYGFSAESIIPMLTDLGDASAALGGDPEKLKRMVTAIGQISNKGKVSQEELNQLTEAGIPVFQILQKELGLSAEQMGNIGAQGISSDKAIQALLKGMRGLYGGGMAAQAKTLGGVISTIKDNLNLLATDIGRELIPMTTKAAASIIKMLEGFRDMSPTAKRAIAYLLAIGTVGAALVSVGARIAQVTGLLVLMSMQRKRMAAEAVTAEQQEQAAINATTVAYDRKVAAMRAQRAANAAAFANPGGYTSVGSYDRAQLLIAQRQPMDRRVAAAMAAPSGMETGQRRSILNMGPMGGAFGQAQQMLGIGLGMVRFGQGMAETDTNKKIRDLGAAAGYVAGAFNPLIFAATGVADALASIIEKAGDKKAAAAAEAAAEAPGIGPDGLPIYDRKELRKQYQRSFPDERFEPGSYLDELRRQRQESDPQSVWSQWIVSADKNRRRVEREAAEKDTKAARKALEAKLAEERLPVEDALAAAEARTARERAIEDLIAARNGGKVNRGGSLTALWDEAKAHEALAKKLREQAAAETDETKQKNLNTDAAKQHNEALNDQADAYKMVSTAQAEMAETAKKAREQAEKDRQATLDAAQAKADYFEAIGGKGSPEARAAHAELSKLYEKEAMLAAQAGDVVGYYKAKTAAVDEYKRSLIDLSQYMDIASAYAAYLETIGQKDAADQLRRTGMAGMAAMQASQSFAAGDVLGGLRAATEAEKLARTGEDAKGGLFGGSTGSVGAMTNALPASMQGALRQSANAINLRMTVNLRDEYGEIRKRQELDARNIGLQSLR